MHCTQLKSRIETNYEDAKIHFEKNWMSEGVRFLQKSKSKKKMARNVYIEIQYDGYTSSSQS